MSAATAVPPPTSTEPPRSPRRRRADLRVSGPGVATVARLELAQRVRSTRWLVALAVWVGVLLLVTVLIGYALTVLGGGASDAEGTGPVVFDAVVTLVLTMGLLVSPALAATSVNGDRSAGTLAPMQVTLLSPLDIALGKLLAAWTASLVLLAAAVPFVVWAFTRGGVPATALVGALALTAVTLLVVCAIGLGWSAVCSRLASSVVLTYVSVAAICFLSPLLFALTVPLVLAEEDVTVREQDYANVEFDDRGEPIGGEPPCVTREVRQDVAHTERTWWLLAPSPYVVVADATPRAPIRAGGGPLAAVGDGVRAARQGETDEDRDYCQSFTEDDFIAQEQARRDALDQVPPVWPWGLAADLLVGAAALAVTVRRLQVPYATLPRGSRVA